MQHMESDHFLRFVMLLINECTDYLDEGGDIASRLLATCHNDADAQYTTP